LLGFGFLLFAVPSYPVVLVAQVVWAVGYTFTSGADVAWITDEVGEEAARPLYVRARKLGRAILAGTIMGAALGAIALWLAIVEGAVLQLINAVWLWYADCPRVRRTRAGAFSGTARSSTSDRAAHHRYGAGRCCCY
jgi:hypothetical protein